jgi:inner membrane protein
MKIPSLAIKIGVLLLLILLLQLPSNMLSNLISERQSYQDEVAKELTASNSGRQTITGPVLVVPYKQGNLSKKLYVLPKELNIDSTLTAEQLRRSIYTFQTYQSSSQFTGLYDTSAVAKVISGGGVIDSPYLAVSVSDTRGLGKVDGITLDGKTYTFGPGAKLNTGKDGLNAPLQNANLTNKATLNFSMKLDLSGTSRLSFVPIGENTTVKLSGNWPHPKFVGERSPKTREIDPEGKGFTATWESSWFANNLNTQFIEAETNGGENADFESFDTDLIQTVDHYQLNERIIKYSMLLIGMTFLCVFMFEVLRQLRVHPIQYALVGIALSVFYLLLLALSEQIGFTKAYIIASAACIAQIGFYVSHILHSIKRGIGFSLFLALIYAALYSLLKFEEMAMVVGSVGLFIVISIVMIATRRLNWYAVGTEWETPKTAQPDMHATKLNDEPTNQQY